MESRAAETTPQCRAEGNVALRTYVADTHSLIWYLGAPERLGPRARQAFAEAAQGYARVVVPTIVIAELIFIVERGRVRADVSEIVRRLRASGYFEVVPLTLGTTLRLRTLSEIAEVHDRILVAEALARGGTLITRDRAITRAAVAPVIW